MKSAGEPQGADPRDERKGEAMGPKAGREEPAGMPAAHPGEKTDYDTLCRQAEELLKQEPWYVSALSNLSALIYAALPDLNWAGFYLLRDGRLTVGPFQGKPACIHIPVGRGVCGTAIGRDETLNVPDVHAFPGHIACDSASASEIVLPVHADGRAAAVLDIDSPRPNRFSAEEEAGLKRLVRVMEAGLRFPPAGGE